MTDEGNARTEVSAYEAANGRTPALQTPLRQLYDEHAPLRQEMDAIFELAHGIEDAPLRQATARLAELAERVERFDANLHRHSSKEEDLLFPMMARYIGRDSGPIAVMEYEHDQAKQCLRLFKERREDGSQLTDPSTIAEMGRLASDAVVILMDHFCKEEHALFPMANTMLSRQELDWLEKEFERIDEQGGERA
ncbi:hemerythrin domain-containing protein [Paenibacillus methanolicus]|uniref:Hemerythrin HHE cation binding domain-containing protein n=1 Tax=Paenibacillus methanolicus TaxID=582686 RepID=A0A5S5CAP3_9BACL|nr:hemerythrin domain-containing protein [Paenibacillus methanolicus]TYP76475.1 hemerythrin HHE cation binding domain-containing protein [Paenibacillus methanolicus]